MLRSRIQQEDVQGYITDMDKRNLRIRVGKHNLRMSAVLFRNVAQYYQPGDRVKCGHTKGSAKSVVRAG